MNTSPEVTVVIPNWNGAVWLPNCLNCLTAQTYRNFKILLVDNGSTDDSLTLVRRDFPQVGILAYGINRGFAPAVNAGIRASSSPYIALLNTDTQPSPRWLEALVSALDGSPADVGAVVSLMVEMEHPDLVENAGDALSWQGAAVKQGRGKPVTEYSAIMDIFSPCAGAALYRRSFFEDVGEFDERFFIYLEDVDLGFRGRRLGYRYRLAPDATVLHKGHGSGVKAGRYVRLITRNRLLMMVKNVPAPMLFRHFFDLVYGQWYFFVAYRRPIHSLLGMIDIFPHLRYLWRCRAILNRRSKVSAAEVDRWLLPCMPEPPLWRCLLDKLRGRS